MESYEEEYRDNIEFFLDTMESLRSIYYENIRLRKENQELRERCEANHKQIMNMARMSEEGLHNWINAICKGDIKINKK